VDVQPGDHNILINKHGNNPFEQQFTVNEAQTEYTFVLENMSPLISVGISTQPQGMLVDLDSQTGICMTNCNSVFTGPGTHLVVIRDPNEVYQTETILHEFLQAGDELFVQMTN
jgi:hypothetical protein